MRFRNRATSHIVFLVVLIVFGGAVLDPYDVLGHDSTFLTRMIAFFGFAIPASILAGFAVFPLQLRVLLLINIILFLGVATWGILITASFRHFYGGATLSIAEFVVSIAYSAAVMVPVVAAECGWLFVIVYLYKRVCEARGNSASSWRAKQ